MRGWGSPAAPDPVLLVPRGFDAAAQRFRYDVNPRFADTRPGRTLLRNPFRLVHRLLAEPVDRLRPSAVAPRRGAGEEPGRLEAALRRFARGVLPAATRRAFTSCSLSSGLAVPEQRAGRGAAAAPTPSTRRGCAPSTCRSAEFLARGQGGAGKAELDSVQTAQKAYWKIFWEQPEIADSIVTRRRGS